MLCGGRSRRMGTDKALLELGGRAMARRVADALTQAGAAPVVAVGGDAPALSALGLEVCADPWPGEGPLGGVIAALRLVGSGATVVVLSCDLLDPDPGLVGRLVVERERLGVDLVVPVAGGHPQWTHGAWRRGAADVLADRFSSGERSLAAAASSLRCTWIEWDRPGAVADADGPWDLPPGT